MPKLIDRVGMIFGELTVISQDSGRHRNYRTYCTVQCSCGTVKEFPAQSLVGGVTSCGCVKENNRGTHKLSHTAEYVVYSGLKSRCTTVTHTAYADYGGRGIKLSDSWMTSFENFLGDMGKRPGPKYTVERIDVNGDYCKENCIWTDDRGLQSYNSRKRSDNKSGKTGVCWFERTGRWSVEINKDKVKHFLGYYKDLDEAIRVREQAELEYYGFIKE